MAKIKQNTNLNDAYDLVLTDLQSKLVKMKAGIIKLGDLGTFTKKQRIIRSALNKARVRTFVYWRISFKASSKLKKELDK